MRVCSCVQMLQILEPSTRVNPFADIASFFCTGSGTCTKSSSSNKSDNSDSHPSKCEGTASSSSVASGYGVGCGTGLAAVPVASLKRSTRAERKPPRTKKLKQTSLCVQYACCVLVHVCACACVCVCTCVCTCECQLCVYAYECFVCYLFICLFFCLFAGKKPKLLQAQVVIVAASISLRRIRKSNRNCLCLLPVQLQIVLSKRMS